MMTQEGCFKNMGNYCGRSFLDYKIKSGDKVLDIGGGNHPFIFATHILDSCAEEFKKQRSGDIIKLHKGQELIEGTTDILPEIPDKEFDFVYCSHVLEHIDNLPFCLEEIGRIGKRGFVAVPHYLGDFIQVARVSGHKWFCDYKNGILKIMRRLPTDFDSDLVKLWTTMMWNGQNINLCKHWEGHDGKFGSRFLWEIRFFWEDKIDWEIDEDFFPQLKIYRDYVGGCNDKLE